MGKKAVSNVLPNEMLKSICLPDVYEFMSMVEDAIYPITVNGLMDPDIEIVDNHRLRLLDRRATRSKSGSLIETGYCWAPVYVTDSGRTEWSYSDFMEEDNRVFKFLPEKNKAYREAVLWNRRRVQTLINGGCVELPNFLTRPISEYDYWCLFGELVILSIATHIPKCAMMFEDAADVPKYLSENLSKSTGPYVFADETYLNPGKNLDRYTYEDLLKPVYLRFTPDKIMAGERYDLMYRSMENWKANAEVFGFQI